MKKITKDDVIIKICDVCQEDMKEVRNGLCTDFSYEDHWEEFNEWLERKREEEYG